MDAKVTLNILKRYREGDLNTADASLALVIEGHKAEEVKKMLDREDAKKEDLK